MEKAVRIFHSFAEAGKADDEYYRSLTPEQRLEILLELVQSQQPDEAEQRLERVCRIIKLQED
jgi:ABC-type multidrug transport system ATPase subunit